jgi:hypothetical protein
VASAERSVALAPVRSTFSLRDLFRLAVWGMSAGCALFIALYAATTEIGQARLHLAFAEIRELLMPAHAEPIRPLDARELRRVPANIATLQQFHRTTGGVLVSPLAKNCWPTSSSLHIRRASSGVTFTPGYRCFGPTPSPLNRCMGQSARLSRRQSSARSASFAASSQFLCL